jgi:hypothetical protein
MGRNFSFYSIVAALRFLEKSPSCIFLADCPDTTFVTRDERGHRFAAPCKIFFLALFNGTVLRGD